MNGLAVIDEWEQHLPRKPWILGRSDAAFAKFLGVPRPQAKAMLKGLVNRHPHDIIWVPILSAIGTGVAWIMLVSWVVDLVDDTPWDFVDAVSDAGVVGDLALLMMGPGLMVLLSSVVGGILANLSLRRWVLRCLCHPECIACGYDLTGLASGTDKLVCPECGAPARMRAVSRTPSAPG